MYFIYRFGASASRGMELCDNVDRGLFLSAIFCHADFDILHRHVPNLFPTFIDLNFSDTSWTTVSPEQITKVGRRNIVLGAIRRN